MVELKGRQGKSVVVEEKTIIRDIIKWLGFIL